MKTRCPGCQTTFRVTSEQLKARAGKVRCGQCQAVFNALDALLDEEAPFATLQPPSVKLGVAPFLANPPRSPPAPENIPALAKDTADVPSENLPDADDSQHAADDAPTAQGDNEAQPDAAPAERMQPLTESAAQELGKVTGLILPRETTEIPGYSKWSEGVMSAPFAAPDDKASRWPFIIVAVALVLALAGQIAFRFRSELATTAPSLRPMLAALGDIFNADLPLPRHVELMSIETSDLQADPARGNLLVLNATLRNRANYAQAYPALELSLTDTQDTAIARRVFPPAEYLSPKVPAEQPFAANSEITVRLWIEAREISASGYRLYVFYP